jgi:hypothetical protein
MADDILKEAKDAFDASAEASNDNRQTALDDVRFARLSEQWPDSIIKQRERDGRPCLTINKLPAFIRQVVNDARQNKPSIKVHPADSGADPETAEVINGLIRNIEYASSADVAYDTGVECAVTCGFGYWRVGLDYAFDDSFEMDLKIKRVLNPFSVYGDPHSTEADSSDWNSAFVVDRLTKADFEAQYGDKAKVDWDDTSWSSAGEPWRTGNEVMVAEWWRREEKDRKILLFADTRDGSMHVYSEDQIAEDEDFQQIQQFLEFRQERMTKSHQVTQHIMTGAEILKSEPWPGRYIPIIPVYGDEFDVQGKRYFRSLIHNAKDAQRSFNYWRTASTELVALAPRVPFIGPKGAFDSDINRWMTANTRNHPFLEYDPEAVVKAGGAAPQRQPMDTGVAAGALQEALNASDDIKAIVGMYDASLGARSNETSGKAIMARQQEGDTATFDYQDALNFGIQSTGEILLSALPKVYDTPRSMRVLGKDGAEDFVQLYQPTPDGKVLNDLSAGKYDVTVTTGPSYDTQRMEFVDALVQLSQGNPLIGQAVPDLIVGSMDFPKADEAAERLKMLLPPPVQQAMAQKDQSPAVVQLQGQLQQMQQMAQQQLGELQQRLQQAEAKASSKVADELKAQIAAEQLRIDWYEAETARLAVLQKDIAAVRQVNLDAAAQVDSSLQQHADRVHDLVMAQQAQQAQAAQASADQQASAQ